MKYKLTASYTRSSEFLREFPCLRDFSYSVETDTVPELRRVRDLTGTLDFYETYSRTIYSHYIEINTLEELQKLQAAIEYPL